MVSCACCFSLTDESIISSRSVHLHFLPYFHFPHTGSAFYNGVSLSDRRKAFLLPETLPTWWVDYLICCKNLHQHSLCSTQKETLIRTHFDQSHCISVRKSTNRNLNESTQFTFYGWICSTLICLTIAMTYSILHNRQYTCTSNLKGLFTNVYTLMQEFTPILLKWTHCGWFFKT